MYDVIFYETEKGDSDVWNFLEELRIKSESNKDARIQYRQMIFYIELLEKCGTNLPNNISKHLVDDIWELRPGNNRVFYFYFNNQSFVLLHHFRKKTQRTPIQELEKAIREKNDYIKRM